ncbi:MAG TPA: HEAT repeat domain-containing protein [Gemmatimonadaceae bacterium]|nr:HEAT repeat domain-containing protein [Gemmatimonadaceae bacterium]
MPRRFFAAIVIAATSFAAPLAAQGTLAARIAQAADGEVRMQYDARTGVCGDGRGVVGFRRALFADSFESYGRWSDARCVPGPLRVSLTVENGKPVSVRTQVGGAWREASGRVTDLGVVSSRDAAAWFLAHVSSLEGSGGKRRILLPAVLAADVAIVPDLFAIARDSARRADTRRQALQWVGQLGGAGDVPALAAFARGTPDVARAALAALATIDDGAGVPALIELAHSGDDDVRHDAVFWLGQTGDARAVRALHAVIEDQKETERVRRNAIFALSHGDGVAASEFAYLRGIFPSLQGTRLKESVIQGVAEEGADGGRWLLERVRDPRESTAIRRSALFWAGQRDATPTRELVAAYRDLDEPNLREHAIFVLSQRDDDAALDALMQIARTDPDRRMRGKALFWLAQKKDDRVTKLISDLLTR